MLVIADLTKGMGRFNLTFGSEEWPNPLVDVKSARGRHLTFLTVYLRVTTTPNSPRKSVKVVESVREGFKVKQKMILYVGVATDESEIEKLKQIGQEFIVQEQIRREKESAQIGLFDTQDKISLADLVEEKRIIEGIHDIAGEAYRKMGYDALCKRKKDADLLKDLVIMRLVNPTSKLKTQEILDKRFSKTHDLDAIYRVIDKLAMKIGEMKKITFQMTQKLLAESIDLIFFDCTTLYFESTDTDELRQFGYSKNHRFNTTQVVLALATNRDGLPIGYELFEGNKAEVKTLLACLDSWKKIFTIQSVCFVADRAMMSDDNLKMLEKENYHYIVAAKLRSLPKKKACEILEEKINYQSWR